MPTIGFLHTADVHVETFRSLVAERSSEVEVVEVVDAELLARASTGGSAAVRDEVTAAVEPDVETVVVAEAWDRFHAGYLDMLAAAVDHVEPDGVVVLAQGSMAALVERFPDRAVLASPALAVAFAFDRLGTTG